MVKFQRPPGWVKGRQLTAGERDEARHMLQALFEGVRLVRNAIEPQTGLLGLSVGQWRSQWDALRRDLDSFTQRVSKGYRLERAVLEVRIDGDDTTSSLLADLPEDGSELFVMVRARRGRIEIRKCASGWWGADEHLSGE
jgi:uncharacterized protein (DUF2267 family)